MQECENMAVYHSDEVNNRLFFNFSLLKFSYFVVKEVWGKFFLYMYFSCHSFYYILAISCCVLVGFISLFLVYFLEFGPWCWFFLGFFIFLGFFVSLSYFLGCLIFLTILGGLINYLSDYFVLLLYCYTNYIILWLLYSQVFHNFFRFFTFFFFEIFNEGMRQNFSVHTFLLFSILVFSFICQVCFDVICFLLSCLFYVNILGFMVFFGLF